MSVHNEELRAKIKALWNTVRNRDIADQLGISQGRVSQIAKALGLPSKKMRAQRANSEANGRRAGDIVRRHHARQPDPVRLVPSPVLFGAPLRILDDDTRRLIDRALRERRKGRRKA